MKRALVAAALLASLLIVAAAALAQTARLSTGATCIHQGATIDTAGNIAIVCAGDPPPPPPPPPVEESCADFVMRMYRTYLGRDADPGGLAFWSGQCSSGAMTRAQIEDAVKASPERQQPPPPPTGGNPSAIEPLSPAGDFSPKPSGYVRAIPLIQSPTGRAAVRIVQGQRPGSPQPATIEYQASRTPGVIDPAAPNYYRSTAVDFNAYEIYSRERPEIGVTQAYIAAQGAAWAPGGDGWYVNIRWTYDGPLSAFFLQWGEGTW